MLRDFLIVGHRLGAPVASSASKVLASSSALTALAAGRPDNGVTRAYALKQIGEKPRSLDGSSVSADSESGFARHPEASTSARPAHFVAGVAGFSIEDYTGDPRAPFYSLNEFVEAAARLRERRSTKAAKRVLLDRASDAWVRDGRRSARGAAPTGCLHPGRRRRALRAGRARTRQKDIAAVVRVAGKLPVNSSWSGAGLAISPNWSISASSASRPSQRSPAPPGWLHARGARHRGARPLRRLNRTCPPQGDRRGVRG